MEILATEGGLSFVYWIFWFLATVVFVISANVLVCAKSFKKLYGVLGLVVYVVIMAIGLYLGYYEKYDAIVTDWNEVYEQGYEVVETNGQIITLRKVDE